MGNRQRVQKVFCDIKTALKETTQATKLKVVKAIILYQQ